MHQAQFARGLKSARAWFAGAALGLGVIFAACYPGDLTSVTQTDVVATRHDSTADFSQETYFLPDTVVQLWEDSAGSIPLSHEFDDLIISTIADSMSARGYTRVTDVNAPEPPDYVLFVSVIAVEQDFYVYSPGWCSGWGGWGGWGWYGGCWGGYWPPQVGSGTYEQGTVYIDMIPEALDNTVEPPQFSIQWTAAFSGLLGTQTSVTASRITSMIGQAFEQSQYVTRN